MTNGSCIINMPGSSFYFCVSFVFSAESKVNEYLDWSSRLGVEQGSCYRPCLEKVGCILNHDHEHFKGI